MQIFSIITLAFDFCQVHYGVGRHQYYLSLTPQSLQRLSQAVKWQYISQPVVIISTMFTKVSICFLLIRVFGIKKSWRWGLYSIMTFATVTNISSAAIVLAQCQPVQKLWNPLLRGTCWTPHTEVAIGDYNGGKRELSPNVLEYQTDLPSSCLSVLRLDTGVSTYRVHMESPDEPQAQDEYMHFDGYGNLVSHPIAADRYANHPLIGSSSTVAAFVLLSGRSY